MIGLISMIVVSASAPGLTAEANVLSKAGRTHEARLLMEQAFLLAPADLPVLSALARLREDDGDQPGAIEALDSFLVLQSSGSEAAEAQKHLERLKTRARPIPEAAREAYARAGALLRLGRTGEALTHLLEAELLAPHWVEVLSWLATYYEQNDLPAEALPRLRRMMAVATESELVRLQPRTAAQQIRADDQQRAARAREQAQAADRAQAQRDTEARVAHEDAEQKARELARQEAVAEAERLEKAAAIHAHQEAEQARATTRRLGIAVAGLGAAALVTTAVFEGLALDAQGKVKNGGLADSEQITAMVAANNTFSTVALTTAVTGGALAVSGVLLYLVNRDGPASAVSVGVVQGGAVLSLRGALP